MVAAMDPSRPAAPQRGPRCWRAPRRWAARRRHGNTQGPGRTVAEVAGRCPRASPVEKLEFSAAAGALGGWGPPAVLLCGMESHVWSSRTAGPLERDFVQYLCADAILSGARDRRSARAGGDLGAVSRPPRAPLRLLGKRGRPSSAVSAAVNRPRAGDTTRTTRVPRTGSDSHGRAIERSSGPSVETVLVVSSMLHRPPTAARASRRPP
jgi:hypothetical protein